MTFPKKIFLCCLDSIFGRAESLPNPTTIAKRLAIHVFLPIVLKQDGTMVFSKNQIPVVARLYIEFGRFQ